MGNAFSTSSYKGLPSSSGSRRPKQCLRVEFAQVSRTDWWHTIYGESRDFNIDELRAMDDDSFEFNMVRFSPFQTSNVDDPDKTVISSEILNNELLPLVLSHLCDQTSLEVLTQEDYKPVEKLISAKEVKNLYLIYGPGIDLLILNKLEQGIIEQLFLGGNWPEDFSPGLTTLASFENVFKLVLIHSNLSVSADLLRAYVDRWSTSNGQARIELHGKKAFKDEEVKNSFQYHHKRGYYMGNKIAHYSLDLKFEKDEIHLKSWDETSPEFRNYMLCLSSS
ncbi:hypothetical protein L596_021517 [Steinernema carpocapsae]|uniref:F-box associated domain-containing protein n=1 Tax=Steinernema carpocapsae TaxID=34508 RepID=A0A4U5MJT3_STECR|nr:hypothetical protein L596_021517 [Steinernema carpocapsae]